MKKLSGRPGVIAAVLPVMVALCIGGCSIRPVYQVRVINKSGVTVAASLIRDVAMDDDQSLAQATILPGQQATLGPAPADPLDPVELVVTRPQDARTFNTGRRLRRGNWTATVHDSGMDSWNPLTVAVTRD